MSAHANVTVCPRRVWLTSCTSEVNLCLRRAVIDFTRLKSTTTVGRGTMHTTRMLRFFATLLSTLATTGGVIGSSEALRPAEPPFPSRTSESTKFSPTGAQKDAPRHGNKAPDPSHGPAARLWDPYTGPLMASHIPCEPTAPTCMLPPNPTCTVDGRNAQDPSTSRWPLCSEVHHLMGLMAHHIS